MKKPARPKKKNPPRPPDPARWKTTEKALTQDLSEDLRAAWLKIKDFAAGLGEHRFYASGKALVFSRKTCFFFVRPRKSYLEVVLFLDHSRLGRGFAKVTPVSKTKYAHTFRLLHEDQIEGALTEALASAYDLTPEMPADS